MRWELPDARAWPRLLEPPLPLGLSAGIPRRSFHRDVYFDTPAGELRRRGLACRIRYALDDRRWLALETRDGPLVAQAEVPDVDLRDIVAGASEPARRLRAVIDPARLAVTLELETESEATLLCWRPLALCIARAVRATVTARAGDLSAQFHDVTFTGRSWARPVASHVARALVARAGLAPVTAPAVERAEALLAAAEGQRLARAVQGPVEVAVIAVAHGRLALRRSGAELTLPVVQGGGEDGCRAAMRRLLGSPEGDVRLLGTVPPAGARPALEVWVARRLHRSVDAAGGGGLQWFAPAEVVALVGSPILRDSRTLAALTVAARSDLVPEWSAAAFTDGAPATDLDDEAAIRVTLSELRVPVLPGAALDADRPAPEQFINAELSWLAFNARVLELARDPATPLLARLRFLSIVSTNLDQFFMVQVGGLQHAVASGRTRPSVDGLSPQETLDAIAIRLRPLLERQDRTFEELRAGELPARGVSIVRWPDIEAPEQARLREYAGAQVQPLLTPKALTRAPGHPFPFIGDRRLSLAVVLRDRPTSPVHYAHLEIPEHLPRFVPLADGRRFVPVEELVRATLEPVFPGRQAVDAYVFRVTRRGDIQLDETATASFVQAIEEEIRRRPSRPVVRIEVERTMPRPLRDLLRREFRFSESDERSALTEADVYEARGLVDLGALCTLGVPAAEGADYPTFTPTSPFAPDRPVFDQLDERDVLAHHPYDSFPLTFERFLSEAADDPDVSAIKLTLYRLGGPSAIADALRRAAAAGKDVSVCIELKASFDEAANIQWARRLEREGIHVVTGLIAFKTHAKLALVVRRGNAAARVRRYAHIGTGNYNRETAAAYTDLGLFTADAAVAEDVQTLFNELTGSSQPPQGDFRRLLVAPTYMLPRLLALIEREADHARAGRGGRIRAKLNGLADAAVIGALYRAAQAGVDVDLVVRGICMLRPGVPGLSDRIRVVSVLGRFLEHGRIYHFANGGASEYFIGSADWRPRNLRRRVDVAVPVTDPNARARLDLILETELCDPGAWILNSDGSYSRSAPPGAPEAGAQQRLLELSSR